MTNDSEALDQFASEVLAQGKVWIIEDSGGMAVVHSHLLPRDAVPFWSSEKLASNCCSGEWDDFRPRAVSLERLLEVTIPRIEAAHALVGVNWKSDMTGAEYSPDELTTRLT